MKFIALILSILLSFSTTLLKPFDGNKLENQKETTLEYEILWPDVTINYKQKRLLIEPRPMTYTTALTTSSLSSVFNSASPSMKTTTISTTISNSILTKTNSFPKKKSHLINIICNSCNNLVINNNFV